MKPLLGLLLACGLTTASHAGEVGDEARLRAAFVHKLMRFAIWPDPIPADKPLVLCHAGVDFDTEAALQRLEAWKQDNRKLKVRKVIAADQMRECHALVIGDTAPLALSDTLPMIGVLTVGTQKALHSGGSVALVVNDDRMTMAFNDANLRHAKVELPAQVLALGRHVRQ